MDNRINIYQMYSSNNYKFGFYVKKNSWSPDKYAKVIAIQWVEEGKPIKGDPPYYGGFKNPPEHPRAGKIMGPRKIVLAADWLDEYYLITDGGNYSYSQVYPKNIK